MFYLILAWYKSKYFHQSIPGIDLSALSPRLLGKWKDLKQLVKIVAMRQIKGKTSTETRYYISSLENDHAEKFNEMVRGHWSIENQLHWHLDVTFREDDSATAKVKLHISSFLKCFNNAE